MKDNFVNKNNSLAGWIDDFINSFAKTTEMASELESQKEVEPTKEVTSEINLNDLDKVTWNDETYYVYFDEDGATVINVFGNIATSFEGLSTIEEVNEKLNAKQIVSSASDNEVEENVESDLLSDVEDIEEVIQESLESIESNEEVEEVTNETTEEIEEVSNEEIEPVVEEEVVEDSSVENVNIDELLNNRLVELEDKLFSRFEEKVNDLMDKMFARINPQNIENLDINAEEVEIDKFTEEAINTEIQIEEENETDRTTPEGKYSTEEEVIEEITEVEEVLNEEIENNIEDSVETEEVINEEIDNEIEEVVEEVVENEENNNEEILEIEVVEDDSNDTVEAAVEDSKEEKVEITGEDAKNFKQTICPCCFERLVITKNLEDSVEITCENENCGLVYVVDTETGKIYFK